MYTSREVAAAVVWADYEGSTWSQLRARNAKVLYRSTRRMGPDTAPTKRLQAIGHHNILVHCFLKTLPVNHGGNTNKDLRGRELAVQRCLRWNANSESRETKWKEAESRAMLNENLRWRRTLITDSVRKVKEIRFFNPRQRVLNFGAGSTAFLSDTESSRGLERTISHIDTKVSTSAKVAARKVKGGENR